MTNSSQESQENPHKVKVAEDNSKKKKKKKSPPVPVPNPNEIYRPIMLHMKCRGTLSFSPPSKSKSSSNSNSKKTNNANANKFANDMERIKSSLPKCYGIQSRLQPVREYPPMKPHAALHTFTNQSSFYHPESGSSGVGGGGGGGGPFDQYHSSNSTNNKSASFGGRGGNHYGKEDEHKEEHEEEHEQAARPKLPFIVDTKWDELKEQLSERSSDIDVSKFYSESSSSLKDGDTMNFHGSTDVYLLVLRSTNGLGPLLGPGTGTGTGTDRAEGSSTSTNRGIRNHPTLFRPPPWLAPYPDERTPNPWNNKNSPSLSKNKKSIQSEERKDDNNGNDNDNDNSNNNESNDNNDNNESNDDTTTIDNQNQHIVYALTPINAFGVSSREVKDGRGMSCSSTTVKLGPLEVHLANFVEEIEIHDDDDDDDNNNNKREGDRRREDPSRSMVGGDDFGNRDGISIDSIMSSVQKGKYYLDKVEKVGDKIQTSMVQNIKFVKKELENDFVNRSITASEKIVGNFGKTLKRMEKLAFDVWKMWTDNGPGGGRRGGGDF